jgi:hypothetical protein
MDMYVSFASLNGKQYLNPQKNKNSTPFSSHAVFTEVHNTFLCQLTQMMNLKGSNDGV